MTKSLFIVMYWVPVVAFIWVVVNWTWVNLLKPAEPEIEEEPINTPAPLDPLALDMIAEYRKEN